ncbi:MAG: outer membrane protein assembly factor BamB [Planctomycetota bacterium]|jgi:outer membrane protein assembly factor BamB
MREHSVGSSWFFAQVGVKGTRRAVMRLEPHELATGQHGMAQMMTFGWRVMSMMGASMLAITPVSAQFGRRQEAARPFSIYATEAARSLAERADDHLAAGRISDAIVDLQALLEDHSGEVLPATRPIHNSRPSEGDVHRGAADHARRRLLEQGDEGRELYERRYGSRAKVALDAARDNGDRLALTGVARRWPLTDSARQAWWALGDLELEIGNHLEALRAWEQALGLLLRDPVLGLSSIEDWKALEDRVNSQASGTLTRIQLAIQLLEGNAPGSRDLRHQPSSALGSALGPSVPLGGTGSIGGSGTSDPLHPPGRDADGWRTPFKLPDDHPFDKAEGRYSLFPARSEDAIFVSTGIELYCVNAYTGELSWRSGEPDGWDKIRSRDRIDYMDAVERRESLIAPAVAQGIVVSALQIPHSFESKIDYGEMSIIKQLPNRRLFAYDARTGEKLWSTEPPPLWDGEWGDFSDRMRIVGSPVISGSRVLVPAARMRGRIEYHVGCFDLFTGETLWSTAVITGQRERNMFGRAVTEFAPPPLVVDGSQLIAQTQLGTVAALNLFTGDLIWEVLYEKIPLKAAHNFSAPTRSSDWKNAPPVVVGETIIATPDDSEFLIAIDRTSGSLIWSHRHDSLRRLALNDTYFDVLLGADERTVYLGGKRVIAIDFPLGIHTAEQPPARRWIYPATRLNFLPSRTPRPVLTANRVWIPDSDNLVGVDRVTGKEVEGVPLNTGNVLIGEGVLFSLISDRLDGKFEWSRLLERARTRRTANPDDMTQMLTLAQLLEERGRSESMRGRFQESSRHLSEARDVIETFTNGAQVEAHPLVQARLHAILRAEASTLRSLGDSNSALDRLTRARTLAPDRLSMRDTLLEELELYAPRDTKSWLRTLETLDTECGDMSIEVQSPHGLAKALDSGLLRRHLSEPDSRNIDENASQALPIGLWIRIVRALRLDTSTDGDQVFADLHQTLARYGHLRIDDVKIGDWAQDRIGQRLRRGLRRGYDIYEVRAAKLFKEASEQGDPERLERIAELYPHSPAAQTASDERAKLALAAGEAGILARITLGELTETWTLAHATDREVQQLLRLAEVFGPTGNEELRAGLSAAMAKMHGSVRSDLESHAGKTVADLAEEWRLPQRPLSAGAASSFQSDLSISRGMSVKGNFLPLGEIPPAVEHWPAGDGHVVLFADEDRLVALGSKAGDDGTPVKRWERVLTESETPDHWGLRFASSAGRVHLATYDRVLAWDRDSGEVLWHWPNINTRADLRKLTPERIVSSDGVIAVTLKDSQNDRSKRRNWLVGLDAADGVELWKRELDTKAFTPMPVTGDGVLCLMPTYPAKQGLVLNTFTSHVQTELEIPNISQPISEATWIEDNKLLVPRFLESRRASRNHLAALDLMSGRELWRVDFEMLNGGSQLTRLLRYQGDTFLVVEPKHELNTEGQVYALDTTSGLVSSTPLARFSRQDRWLGVRYRDRTELTSPYIFMFTLQSPTEPLRLRAIHLPYGQRWEVPIGLREADIVRETFPRPGLSSSTVVLGWREMRSNSETRGIESIVAVLDRTSGTLHSTRALPPEMDGNKTLQIVSIGDGLVLCGRHKLEVWR